VTSGIGESLYTAGWDAARSSTLQHARDLLISAARIAPFERSIHTGPAYLALRFMAQIPPDVVISDMHTALRYDPHAPDLLNGAVFVEIYQKDFASADADLATLRQAEPGFTPDYLAQR
jgi:hypothetical protein